jgi:hypothetical protein
MGFVSFIKKLFGSTEVVSETQTPVTEQAEVVVINATMEEAKVLDTSEKAGINIVNSPEVSVSELVEETTKIERKKRTTKPKITVTKHTTKKTNKKA